MIICHSYFHHNGLNSFWLFTYVQYMSPYVPPPKCTSQVAYARWLARSLFCCFHTRSTSQNGMKRSGKKKRKTKDIHRGKDSPQFKRPPVEVCLLMRMYTLSSYTHKGAPHTNNATAPITGETKPTPMYPPVLSPSSHLFALILGAKRRVVRAEGIARVLGPVHLDGGRDPDRLGQGLLENLLTLHLAVRSL